MKYFEQRPHPILADFVKCYWYLEKDYTTGPSASETILPDGCIDFVFQKGSRLHALKQNRTIRQPVSFVIGPQSQPLALTSAGMTITFGIRFYAYGAYPFLRMPLKELANQTADIESLLGSGMSYRVERIAALPVQTAFREMEKFLLEQLSRVPVDILQVEAATQLLFQAYGNVDISAVAYHVNFSTRTLERKFEEAIGQPPKAFARVVRFNSARNALMLNPSLSLTDVAHYYGYFDQAHFIKDFKQFTGTAPSAFVEQVVKQQIAFYK